MKSLYIPFLIKTRNLTSAGKCFKKIAILILILSTIPLKCFGTEMKAQIIVHGPKAQITQLKGGAFIQRKKTPSSTPLKSGGFLRKGDSIYTVLNSSIELKFPDNSYMRFDQLTKFKINAMAFDKKTGVRDIGIHVIQGKAWCNTSLFSGSGFFSISTQNAVADTSGTVLRMDVKDDGFAVIKIYQGEAVIRSMMGPDAEKMNSKKKPDHSSKTSHEWTHIIRPMQQIIIYKDGKVTKPFRFTIKADENRWVQWNRHLDKKIGNGSFGQ